MKLGYHLPNADVQTFPRPVELPITSAIVQISASKYHTIALNAAGECFVWGFGKGGRLGTGTEFEYVIWLECSFAVYMELENDSQDCAVSVLVNSHVEPTQILSLDQIPIVKVAAGENHTLALSRSGQVFSWGANSFGQLGHSLKSCTQQSRMTPKRIDAFRGSFMTDIAASSCHSAAICGDDGAVFTWGSNKKGQLGRKEGFGTDQPYPAPKCVDPLLLNHPVSVIYEEYDAVQAVQVALSDSHTSVILKCSRNGQSHGQVWQFGYGSNYPTRINFKDKTRTGSVLMSDAWIPSWKQRSTDILQISCAQNHSIALSRCGSVYTWGHNGQALSHPSSKQKEFVLPGAPQKVSLAKFGRVASICASQDHCAVVTADGNLITWGCGSQNVLGHGQGNTWQPNPKRVPGVKKAISVATGHQHTAVLVAPYNPRSPNDGSRVAASSGEGGGPVISSLLNLVQQRVTEFMDLSNCVTLWKYANAFATASLEQYAFEFMRMNWDAILEIVGRERLDLLFELFLPPMDKMKLEVKQLHVVLAVEQVPPSPVLTALRDFALDKQRMMEKKVGKVVFKRDQKSPMLTAVATAPATAKAAAGKSAKDPIAKSSMADEERVDGVSEAVTPAKVPRRKAAKFVSLDKFLDPKKKEEQPKVEAPTPTPVARDFFSPWKVASNISATVPPFSPAVSSQQQQQQEGPSDGFSLGKPRPSRKSSLDQQAPASTVSSLRKSSISASPSLTFTSSPALQASKSLLLAQDGSERQLLSTFSLDAFMKKPSRNDRKKGGGYAEPIEEAKPSWMAAPAHVVRSPAKTLKEIQEEEQARIAAEAAAKARNGGFARRTSTVNSWGLCESQSHISLAEVQQIQANQDFLEQQRQILAQIEMEREMAKAKQASVGGTARKNTSKTPSKKDKSAPKELRQESAVERKATGTPGKKKRDGASDEPRVQASEDEDRSSHQQSGDTVSSKKKKTSKVKPAGTTPGGIQGDRISPNKKEKSSSDAAGESKLKSKKKSKPRGDAGDNVYHLQEQHQQASRPRRGRKPKESRDLQGVHPSSEQQPSHSKAVAAA